MSSTTVVVTSHNQGVLIRKPVESARAQTTMPEAVIVVDDGSTDRESLEVLDELWSRAGVVVVRQTNGGPSSARNHGIAMTSSDYVAILDGDDMLLPRFIESTESILDNDPTAVAASGWMRTIGALDSVVRPTGGTVEDFLSHNCCPATCLVRVRSFADSGGYDEAMRSGFEDWDFFLSLLSTRVDAHIAIAPEELIIYRTATTSSNITSMSRRIDLMRHIIGRHHDLYVEHLEAALTRIEAISLSRLTLWETLMRGEHNPSNDFLRHPSYGDGGMATAVRLSTRSMTPLTTRPGTLPSTATPTEIPAPETTPTTTTTTAHS